MKPIMIFDVVPFINTQCMVQEYTERFYLPTAACHRQFTAAGLVQTRELAAWKARVQENWSQVRVEAVEVEPLTGLQVGSELRARARVHLGDLTPDDVMVEFYLVRVDADGEIVGAEATPMRPARPLENGNHIFEAGAVPCCKSGLHGYTVRVLPHPDLQNVGIAFRPTPWVET